MVSTQCRFDANARYNIQAARILGTSIEENGPIPEIVGFRRA